MKLSCENAYTDRSCLGWFSLWPLIWTLRKLDLWLWPLIPCRLCFYYGLCFLCFCFCYVERKKHLLASSISMNLKLLWDELCVSEWNTSYSSLHFKCIVRQPQKRNSFTFYLAELLSPWLPVVPNFVLSHYLQIL